MKLREDSSKAASAKDKCSETKDALSVNAYKKKIKSLKIRSFILRACCNIALLTMFVCIVLCSVSIYASKKVESHTPVSEEHLAATTDTIPEAQYSTKTATSYVKNGVTYYDLTIGGYTTERKEEELDILGFDTVCDTAIYTLTIYNNDSFFLSATVPHKITIVRYSVLGEKPFSKEDISKYKKQAAKYFTYQKYERMNFEDVDEFYVTIKNMAKEGSH